MAEDIKGIPSDQTLTEASSDQKADAFKERARQNLGQLIPLNKHLDTGEQLFLQLRHISIPSDEYPPFKGDGVERRLNGLLHVDVFILDSNPDSESGFRSIAHRDWMLRKDGTANGSGNHRGVTRLYDEDSRNREADSKWQTTKMGIDVSGDAQRQDIGTFMTAISFPVLKDLGANTVYVGGLIEGENSVPIHALWKKFGAEKREEPYPIDQLASHSNVNAVIAEFI